MQDTRDTTTPLLCGTYAGYIRHVKVTGDTPCDDCRAAATTYQRVWRSNPANRARESARREARRRALSRLAAMHPTEYRTLYRAELELPPEVAS